MHRHCILQVFQVVLHAILFIGLGQNSLGQLIVAHRGASHDAPENTLAAFRLAWERDADGIEGDFYLSRDGQIVCIHDKTTERTGGVNLAVAKADLAELKKLDVGSWKHSKFSAERIPTLKEVIATVPEGKRIIIELKAGPEIVAPLQRVLKDSTLPPAQVLVISFNEKTIAESKGRMPEIKAHWLSGYDQNDDVGPWMPSATGVVDMVRRTQADGFGSQANRDIFDDKFIEQLKVCGIEEFHVWTVDDPDDARYYRAQGAFGITTNRPGFIRAELEKKKP